MTINETKKINKFFIGIDLDIQFTKNKQFKTPANQNADKFKIKSSMLFCAKTEINSFIEPGKNRGRSTLILLYTFAFRWECCYCKY